MSSRDDEGAEARTRKGVEPIALTQKEEDTSIMRFESKVGERGEIVIPSDIRQELRLAPNTPILVDVSALIEPTERSDQNWESAFEHIAKLREGMRAQLLADGYATTDEYIADIRGR